jgi:hypothetical protein
MAGTRSHRDTVDRRTYLEESVFMAVKRFMHRLSFGSGWVLWAIPRKTKETILIYPTYAWANVGHPSCS